MKKCIKDSFGLTNKYIILATPLILYSLLSMIQIAVAFNKNIIYLTVVSVILFLLTGAFFSGWFFMITNAVRENEDDEGVFLINRFPEGVGEYFFSVSGAVIFITVLMLILFYAVYFAGMKLIGNPDISLSALTQASANPSALKTFMLSLSREQILKLNQWNILIFLSMSVMYFSLMFYAPAVFFKSKNPLKAFWLNIKDLFGRNFFKNLGLYIFIFVTYFVISLIPAVFKINSLIYFVFTLINFYYIIFAWVLIFNFYYSYYIKSGTKIDTRV